MNIPDTTRGSLIHRLTSRLKPGARLPVAVFVGCVAAAYLPLLAAVTIDSSGDSVSRFLHDWAAAFVLIVSLPTIVVLTATDHLVLSRALTQVADDGVLRFNAQTVVISEERFEWWNRMAYTAGLVVGAVLALATVSYYNRSSVDFWIAGRVSATVYGYCLTLLYAAIIVYVCRSVMVSLFLRRVVAQAEFHMLPFHPDKCGGLQPVGQLGLRNQYMLSLLGINLILLALVSKAAGVERIAIGGTLAYLVLGPIVFMGPLLPFRSGMQKEKKEWIRDIDSGFRTEFAMLRQRMRTEGVTRADAESIERMRKVGDMLDQFPVWPFDATTIRKFATAYAVPLAGTLVSAALPAVMTWLRARP